MKSLFKFFILILMFSSLVQAYSPKEGFNTGTEKMAQALSDNWGSTFFVLIDLPTTYRMGTSFLIHKESKGLVDELYFVTNDHVIVKDCPTKGKCDALKLMQKALIENEKDGQSLVELEDPGVEYTGVEVVKKSSNPDIALLKVVVPKSSRNPSPMKLAENCSGADAGTIYTIGYSDTSMRKSPKHLPIDNQNMIYKRWSQGISTGADVVKIEDEGNCSVIGTTVDALPGGSGGPMLNSKGEVIGVMKASFSVEENKFAYRGSEVAGQLKPTSYMLSCETLRDFLDIEELKSCLHH